MSARLRVARGDLVFAVLFVFLAGFIAGTALAPSPTVYEFRSIGEERVVRMILPAVDSEERGVAATLYTTVKPGSGKILVDASNVLNYIDTQLSGRIAAKAASDYSKTNLSNIDIVYTIDVNASLIEGPSAGASMAISVLLGLDNKTADGIAITGTINPDGTIGRVGSVLEKARAAKENGVSVFLVPKGQIDSEESRRVRSCRTSDGIEFCRISYKTEKVDIGKFLNMSVYEVSTLAEAYGYFLNQTA